MLAIREGDAADLEALYAIVLATGDGGRDASHLYRDKKLIGHIYSAPYLLVDGGFCFVAEDDQGVCGYVVGTADTRRFEARLEEEWWPSLRRTYPLPEGGSVAGGADVRRIVMIHHPESPPSQLVAFFPAHLHMNILARAQGSGLGRRLLDRALSRLEDEGAKAVHVGANADNAGAIAFWGKMGFMPPGPDIDLENLRGVYLARPVTL